jgi:putative endopeptidase
MQVRIVSFPTFLLLLVLGFLACQDAPPPEDSAQAATDYHSGLYLEFMDTTIRPGDDFHAYVNGTWIRETEIPADKARYGVGTMVHEESQDNVRQIIEASSSAENAKGTDEQKVGDLYASFMDLEYRNQLGTDPLAEELARIDAISDKSELAQYFAYANKAGIGSPLGLAMFPDLKNPSRYAMYLWQDGLSLPDREYYLSKDANNAEIRTAFTEYIAELWGLAGMDQGKTVATQILDFETRIATGHIPKEEARNIVALYNPYPLDSLTAAAPDFDWTAFLGEAGLADQDKLVIGMPTFVAAMDELITETPLPQWKTYLKWSLLDYASNKLNEEMDAANFAFYGKVLNGQEEPLPLWRRGVNVVNGNLGEVVGKVYVKEHFPPEAKERMQELVSNLLRAYEASIKELDWMSEETKAQALDKLSKFTPKIGYPDQWREYPAEIAGDDYFGNRRRIALAEHERNLQKLQGPVDKTEWGMTPQTVNAYYNPTMNEIVFPAAILQPPFFDLTADDAVNYGAIGGVIGHEIGHGFDDQGSTFDGDGVLRNWWTDADRAEFKKRTEALVAQYSSFDALEDLKVNGEFTLGENIGDLGGLSIALKAYELSLDGQEAPVIDGYTGVQRVFIGWAQAWRVKSREEALRTQVSTDPHSPAPFRVNGVVRNIPEFYEVFDVQPTDALYLPPEERVKIW